VLYQAEPLPEHGLQSVSLGRGLARFDPLNALCSV
jgi:hypothetical protein